MTDTISTVVNRAAAQESAGASVSSGWVPSNGNVRQWEFCAWSSELQIIGFKKEGEFCSFFLPVELAKVVG